MFMAFYIFSSAYVKCVKVFFGFPKYSNATTLIMQQGIPSFDRSTLVHNAKGFSSRLCGCSNSVIYIILRFADTQNV